jgi:beta-alanine--pyruvate transaminase
MSAPKSESLRPNDLDALFMPYTPQRAFKKKPRMIVRAKGMFYYSDDGRELIDTCAGIWCVNAGHNHPKIVEAIRKQAGECDYAPIYTYGHPMAFQAATRLCSVMPKGFDHVFFSNSGSEAVETAIKIAVAYQRARGKGSKHRIIGRARAFHGNNIGGMSVGGIHANRVAFGSCLMPGVDHLPHTHNLEMQAFSRGRPDWGGQLALALEHLVALHDASNIAAVIIEPVMGSTGVLVPPKGYLEKIREICTAHDILLIFDEVITAFGRLGRATGSEYFGITPDIITAAKGINSAAVPMGATFMKKEIYDAFTHGPAFGNDFAHGYTYAGHPLACASALAAQDVYRDEGLFENAAKLEKAWEDAFHTLKGAPHVIDVRAIGLMAGVELDPGKRKYHEEPSRIMEASEKMFWDQNAVCRYTGNSMAFSPPLIVNESQIGDIVDRFRKTLETVK